MSTEDPTYYGAAGKAWKISAPEGAKAPLDWQCFLGAFLVNAPHAHLVVDHYIVQMVHLRDIPNVQPAYKDFPDAEYEFLIIGLDPKEEVPDLAKWLTVPIPILDKPEVAVQFYGVADAAAIRILHAAVCAVVSGDLSPNATWRKAWGKAIASTVKHFSAGGHAVN